MIWRVEQKTNTIVKKEEDIMYYRLKDNVGLRKWRYVDRAIYIKGRDLASGCSKEEWEILLQCDGEHDISDNPYLVNLLSREYIERCEKSNRNE